MKAKKTMKEYKQETQPLYQVPTSVQELIPIYRISQDGIFQLENKGKGMEVLFDKAYLFLDTNFATMDESEQEEFLKLYCTTLNSLGVDFKITIMNNNQNMDRIREEIFCHNEQGRYHDLVQSLNKHIAQSMQNGHSGIEQIRIFIITCRRENVSQARDYFRSIEAGLAVNFKRMESGLLPLDASERLRYLHAFYCLGEETDYHFDFDLASKKKMDWRDVIAPRVVKHCQNEYGEQEDLFRAKAVESKWMLEYKRDIMISSSMFVLAVLVRVLTGICNRKREKRLREIGGLIE